MAHRRRDNTDSHSIVMTLQKPSCTRTSENCEARRVVTFGDDEVRQDFVEWQGFLHRNDFLAGGFCFEGIVTQREVRVRSLTGGGRQQVTPPPAAGMVREGRGGDVQTAAS